MPVPVERVGPLITGEKVTVKVLRGKPKEETPPKEKAEE